MSESPEPGAANEAGADVRSAPIEVDAHGLALSHVEPPGSEAHGFSVSPVEPAVAGDPRLTLRFPPGTPPQTIELRYRPAAEGGDEPPEVELHGYLRWSDARLKRDVRGL